MIITQTIIVRVIQLAKHEGIIILTVKHVERDLLRLIVSLP